MTDTTTPTNAGSRASDGSAEWDRDLVENVVANCRQQLHKLRIRMPAKVALAIGLADRELAGAQAWMRSMPPNSTGSATEGRQ